MTPPKACGSTGAPEILKKARPLLPTSKSKPPGSGSASSAQPKSPIAPPPKKGGLWVAFLVASKHKFWKRGLTNAHHCSNAFTYHKVKWSWRTFHITLESVLHQQQCKNILNMMLTPVEVGLKQNFLCLAMQHCDIIFSYIFYVAFPGFTADFIALLAVLPWSILYWQFCWEFCCTAAWLELLSEQLLLNMSTAHLHCHIMFQLLVKICLCACFRDFGPIYDEGHLDFLELCSGSGRLTSAAAEYRLVSLPLDVAWLRVK